MFFKIKDNRDICFRSLKFGNKTLLSWVRPKLIIDKLRKTSRATSLVLAATGIAEKEACGLLRDVQKCQLHLLRVFKKLAYENDILYWLDFGTLLGAARSQKFIPWDDDIDVSVQRTDYEKLLIILGEINDEYILELSDAGVIKLRYKKLPPEISLDIFCIDFISNSFNADESQKLSSKIFNIQQSYAKELLHERILKVLHEVEKLPIEFVDKIESASMVCYSLEFCHCTHPSIFIPIRWLFPVTQIQFEGELYPAPNDYRKHLIYLYRDWGVVNFSHPGHTFVDTLSLETMIDIQDVATQIG